MSDVRDREDEWVIARLRHALDEVAAHPPAAMRSSQRRAAPQRAMGPWIAAAAATLVLVVGGLWALGRRDPGAMSEPALAPLPTGTVPVTVPPPAAADAAWFAIASADLVAQPAGDLVLGDGFGAAWIAAERGDSPRLLLLRVVEAEFATAPSTTVGDLHDFVERPQPDGSVWKFSAIGFDLATAQQLATQVIDGSGLPFILPDPSVRLLAFATPTDIRGRSQLYVGDPGSVVVQVHPYAAQLEAFNDATSTRYVTVAGVEGYAARRPDGSTVVVWPAANGAWASMSIDAALDERVEEIIAAVVPAAPSV